MKTLYLKAACCLLIVACGPKKEQPAGYPAANDRTITIKGSDTELLLVRELADQYSKLHPEIRIDVAGGGSGRGIDALIGHHVEVATASREMKREELNRAEEQGIRPNAMIFAVDALAIVTHSKLGVDSLSTHQLAGILSGEIDNWKMVGGPDLAIHIYGRDSMSGTYVYLKDKFLKNGYSKNMKHLSGNAEIVKAIERDSAGIGYAGVGYLMDENGKPNGRVWAMPIYLDNQPSYSPYEVNAVKRGDYVLTRPLYQYVDGKPGSKINEFLLYELTANGQATVRRFGYFPINDYHKRINSVNGF